LLAILPHDCGGRPQPDSDAAALVDKGALGGNSSDDILGGQYRHHFAATPTGVFASNAIFGVKRFWTASLQISPRDTRDRHLARCHPATLMLKRYGEKALEQSASRLPRIGANRTPSLPPG
jgi:hypothetical protein